MMIPSRGEIAIFPKAITLFFVLGFLTRPGAVYSQQAFRVGSFHVQQHIDPITDEDRSIALLTPTGGVAMRGTVAWACGSSEVGLIVGVSLAYSSRDGSSRSIVWRFDRDKPDTSFVMGLSGGETWFLRDQDLAPFTIRAKTASRLVIRDLGESPSYVSTDYIYDLNGSSSALNRLSCARNPRILGRPVDETVPVLDLDTLSASPPVHEVEETYELSAVEELPRPANGAEFQQLLRRYYPPLLRDAGVTGTVQVRFRVLDSGQVDANSITISYSTLEQFNDPAMRAIMALRFRPAKINGRPVNVWVEQPIQFNTSQE
jgi:TonB family protein